MHMYIYNIYIYVYMYMYVCVYTPSLLSYTYFRICLCFDMQVESIFEDCGNDSQDRTRWQLF